MLDLPFRPHPPISLVFQVVIGGRNKYLINGHAVQQMAVTNLFHSVQLNVNNPHFLIMQVSYNDGRVGPLLLRSSTAKHSFLCREKN